MEISSKEPIQVYDTKSIRFQSLYELQQLLKYRFLVQNLVSRDLKVRYKRSALGFIWVMLNPLFTMLIMVYVFSQLLKASIPHFPTYALAGILLFNVFSQGTVAAMSSLTSNGPILNRIYLPPSVYVVSSINSALVNFFYALVPLAIIAMLIDHILPSPFWLLSIIPFGELTLFTLGIGLIVSALMVYFRDIFEIYTVFLTLLSYLTPLFYPIGILNAQLQSIEAYNPLYIYVHLFRSILEGYTLLGGHEMIIGALYAVITFFVGWFTFTRLERGFAYQF